MATALGGELGLSDKERATLATAALLHGTGADAVITPEMVDFGRRFGFTFVAHKIGDANRSGRVERRFDYVEKNFLAGRVFADLSDLNAQALAFCERVSRKPQRRLNAAPVERFPAEQAAMKPLPPVIPEVYQVAYRIVDVEGYIHLDANTYSVPYELIGRQVEIREGLSRVRVYHGPREVAAHDRLTGRRGQRATDKKHRPRRRAAGRRCELPTPCSTAMSTSSKRRRRAGAPRPCAGFTGCTTSIRRTHFWLRYVRPTSTECWTSPGWRPWSCGHLPGASSRKTPSSPGRTVMSENIDQLCKLLHLKRIPLILDRELKRAQKEKPGYSDLVARLLREEYHHQRERATKSRIKRAKMPELWSLDSFPWDRQPGVDKRALRELAELDFLRSGTNLVFKGDTGVGKTGLATGILLRALQDGYRGYFLKAQDLFDELYSTLADRSSRRFLDRLIRFDLILIDEMGYLNLRPEQTNLFFKLMEERYVAHRASIITTNLDYDQWRQFLGNEHLTSALLSRIRHRCITLNIEGPSLRSPSEQN